MRNVQQFQSCPKQSLPLQLLLVALVTTCGSEMATVLHTDHFKKAQVTSNPTLGYLPREMKTYVHQRTCTQMFVADLCKIAKSWN